MNIPDKIKIGARTYDVCYINPDPDAVFDQSENGELLGQIDYKRLTIKLLIGQALKQLEQSFLHELIHAIAFDMGYSGEHNERDVDLLASALHRLIQDNPELFINLDDGK